MSFHIGRSWSGHPLENGCPCVKAPCGLVDTDRTNPACPEHPAERGKSIRQSHPASECPDARPCECHTFGQCLTFTGCVECRVYGDESCGFPIDPDEKS